MPARRLLPPRPTEDHAEPNRIHRQPGDASSLAAHRLHVFEEQAIRDRRSLRAAGLVAVLTHLGLFAVTFPSLSTAEPAAAEAPKVYVMETVRFEPPKPDPEPVIPKARARIVPIPDPTPDDPEPIHVPEAEEFEVEWNDDLVVAIPDEPPAPPSPEGPIHVTSDVEKPIRLSGPAPRYTEIARRARIQGIVQLEAIIDEQGTVTEIEVRSGLPMGLTEAAVDAARQWRYRPARLNGRPVAVYFILSVHFELN